MNIIRLLMKYILLINRFEDINLNTIRSKFGQTKTILTDTNVIVTFFCGRSITKGICELLDDMRSRIY